MVSEQKNKAKKERGKSLLVVGKQEIITRYLCASGLANKVLGWVDMKVFGPLEKDYFKLTHSGLTAGNSISGLPDHILARPFTQLCDTQVVRLKVNSNDKASVHAVNSNVLTA